MDACNILKINPVNIISDLTEFIFKKINYINMLNFLCSTPVLHRKRRSRFLLLRLYIFAIAAFFFIAKIPMTTHTTSNAIVDAMLHQ